MYIYLQGNNERCVETLCHHVTFEQAIWCVRRHCHQAHLQPDKSLHPSLVSKYVELIKGNNPCDNNLIMFYRPEVPLFQTLPTLNVNSMD